MGYVKKISGNQFVKDVINFELRKFGVDYDYIMSLPEWPENKDDRDPNIEYRSNWFQRYTFDSLDEFLDWKTYFFEHWKEYAPMREWKRYVVEKEFEWFNLMYGLRTNYDFDLHCKEVKTHDIYKKVFKKNGGKPFIEK